MSREVLFINETVHTGHMREASEELLDSALTVARRLEGATEELAKIDPDSLSPEILQAILRPTTLPSKVITQWDRREAWVESFLFSARVIKGAKKVDERLRGSLPSLDPNDPDTAERFLFGSRERVKHLLTGKGSKQIDTLRYGTYAYVESRLLRIATSNGIFLTQAPRAS